MQSRRQFITRAGTVTAATVFAPQTFLVPAQARKASVFKDGKFTDGVSSGDPHTDSITLWTRLDDVSGAGKVRLEVASDQDFRQVVASQTITTGDYNNHMVKARVGSLNPHERYFYRFETNNQHSDVGRFQTALPADSNEPVRFALFSCQLYPHGYFNAHAVMAQEDLDFVLCLGDYIYAETYFDRKPGMIRKDTVGEAKTLAQYRKKYSLYHSDPNLQKMRRNFAMITTWDDHEVVNNYTGKEKGTARRKRAGYQAFFENMPIYSVGGERNRIYRSFQFGKNVELIVADQRQYREDQPCDDAVAPPCKTIGDPRAFLGAKQQKFVQERLKNTPATWKLIGNEVMIMPVNLTASKLQGTFDAWNGYPAEREELLGFIKSNAIQNVAFLTGDIHSFVAGDVQTADGTTVATEFVGGSISSITFAQLDTASQSLKNTQATTVPKLIYDYLRGLNPWVKEADLGSYGYAVVEASPEKLDVTFRRIQTIKKRSTAMKSDIAYSLAAGQVGVSV